ncbi:aminotransferase class V-fold PLP-dependent enzyme [Paenibacillus sp. UMB4589-SE434]|uniref:aminotransferase class V-fold PLP-dependent enzyme n=1 Tax=Paenibacillus sp. UMB4589-SE434 TaxID=3046314 RepID=UPI00254ED708|nr:aminotransferase class V-fold PLP-dependent enzyme [Paenibacillus sp. UMB4589-SE434]MDK8181234.1 aminotransferase class V-fold PLP-dependent enzyme [Paenibacillus sp. UMB4589-SE434]
MGQHRSVIYMDHAATSWPKPAAVQEAIVKAMLEEGANPGRGGHWMAVQAGKRLMRARMALAKLFGIANPTDIAFTLNATMALNMAIHGYVRPGDHVVATAVEHNSVRRPLEWLKIHRDVRVTYIDTDPYGSLNLNQLQDAVTDNTRLVVCNHSSNLLGSILPIEEIAMIAHKKGAKLLVDGAQSAGLLPIDVRKMGIDMLAFPGHKGLLGPTGTGGLYIDPELDVQPIIQGGTGSHSDEPLQPATRPDRYEAGTPNTMGIAGLEAGVNTVLHETVEKLYNKEWTLAQRLMEGLQSIDTLHILGPQLGEPRTGIVSFISSTMDSAEFAFRLDREYGIAVRAGYHCTPLAHQAAGTTATGAVRVSVGWNTTDDDIDTVLDAIQNITEHSIRQESEHQ